MTGKEARDRNRGEANTDALEKITYLSLLLSVVALSLFVVSGFQATK